MLVWGSGGDVVAVIAYMGGTRGSGVLASAGDVLEISVVRGVGGVYDMYMCLARAGVVGVGGERIGFGLYQFWRNMGKVGYVSVFWLWWCGWCWGRVGGWLGPGSRRVGGVMSVCVVSLESLCRWQVQVSVYCARRLPVYLRCTQCSIMLHLIDICFLTCICLWQISQIQNCLRVVVGPGLVSTLPTFMRSTASHLAGSHGRLAQKQ